MSDALKTLDALLQQSSTAPQVFSPTSRYYGLATATLVAADGRTLAYLTRRFVPQSDRFALVKQHVVAQGDRLDNLAAQYFGDPEQYWRLCDANNVLRPQDLIDAIGGRLRVTLPEGLLAEPGGI